MRLLAGTSGFSYPAWRGRFYPEGLADGDMLAFYAQRLPAVEINNTFYRMPTPEVLASWHDRVPAGFQFALKASRRITHQQKLANAVDSVSYLFRVAAILKDKLGPVLFQLPPFLRKDSGLLADFLAALPEGCQAAFEFRHASWFSDDVFDLLKQRGAALCSGDPEESELAPPLVATASWGYLRLRRADYEERELRQWVMRIVEQPWQDVFAFFKHEELGPAFAQALSGLLLGVAEAGPALAHARASYPPPPAEATRKPESTRPGPKSARPKSVRGKSKKQAG